jgi:XRE family aerobic/anaerobic benzoate catabolism transcriptional regulator
MEDLKSILAGRAAFYSKAEMTLDTSVSDLQTTFQHLNQLVRQALAMPNPINLSPDPS